MRSLPTGGDPLICAVDTSLPFVFAVLGPVSRLPPGHRVTHAIKQIFTIQMNKTIVNK